jgi:hypothetical protein
LTGRSGTMSVAMQPVPPPLGSALL